MHAVVIGASGLVGRDILSKLFTNDKISKVTILTRRQLDIFHEKLEQVIFSSFDSKSIEEFRTDAKIFICALGTTIKIAGSKEKFREVDFDFVVSFAKLAKASKADSLFIISALGANKDSRIFYNQVKGEMEEAVSELNFGPVYFLRPSLLVGHRSIKRPVEEVAIAIYRLLAAFLPNTVSRILGTPIEKISNFVSNTCSQMSSGGPLSKSSKIFIIDRI